MNEYETQRLENLAQKNRLLAELNLNSISKAVKLDSKPKVAIKRRKIGVPEIRNRVPSRISTRMSARIASSTNRRSTNQGQEREEANSVEQRGQRTGKKRQGGMKRESVRSPISGLQDELEGLIDVEELRAGWSRWTPTGPPPTREEEGTFRFADYPAFQPNKSPEEVMREGCFGGSYWRRLKSQKLGITVEGDWKELPEEWHTGLDVDRYLTSPRYDAEANKFKVRCGQSIGEWEAAGWISLADDVRGWFQWYCRFFQGRRCGDDERQVGRWVRCVGKKGRWRRTLLKRYMALGVREVFDDGAEEEGGQVSPVVHQTCHHWAWEVRQGVLDDVWREGL